MRHIPNALTLLRFLLIPALVFLLAQRRYDAAFAVFVVSALSDFSDGVIARHWNARTRFGEIADPLADKLTMLAVTITLAVQGLLPLWLVVAILVRDVVIVGGGLAYHYMVGRYDMAPTLLGLMGIDSAPLPFMGRNLLGSPTADVIVRPNGGWTDGRLFFDGETTNPARRCDDIAAHDIRPIEECERGAVDAALKREVSRLVLGYDLQSSLVR